MPAIAQNIIGSDATLYRDSLQATKNEANIESIISGSGNQILGTQSITPPVPTRNTYTRQALDDINDVPVPGRIALGELTFTVYFDGTDAQHTGLRDDDKLTEMTYVIQFEDPADSDNKTYAAFDGIVTQSNIDALGDDMMMMSVSVAMTTDITWVDNS